MAYSEITNEIQEQLNDVAEAKAAALANIAERQSEIDELTASLDSFDQQTAGLNQLLANAQALIASQNDVNVNLNVNVSADSNTQGNITVASATPVQQNGPFS